MRKHRDTIEFNCKRRFRLGSVAIKKNGIKTQLINVRAEERIKLTMLARFDLEAAICKLIICFTIDSTIIFIPGLDRSFYDPAPPPNSPRSDVHTIRCPYLSTRLSNYDSV